ncbi:MAG: threonylcarbamoyl-AMP synthase [Parachlamydiaceae bacterium]|nr:threonylcarbamoyl-AMP synthase [Parachlamydiaceae bacterium]
MIVNLDEAIQILLKGNVLAVPTETVYGLAASLNNPVAIEKIFALKGRPRSNPLIVHVANIDKIKSYAKSLPPYFEELAKAFWPGPLTLIIPIQTDLIPPLVRANLETAGFRIPHHSITLELLQAVGPLVMPSANISGKPSATSPIHVEEDFGVDFPVLNGGTCARGIESTILTYTNDQWMIARLGSLSPEDFQDVLGYQPGIIISNGSEKPLCPGQQFRHYAPKAKIIIGERSKLDKIPFTLGFKERSYLHGGRIIILGSLENANEVAENLYKALRQLDQEGAPLAWVDMNFPREGLWLTIAERLNRAAEG